MDVFSVVIIMAGICGLAMVLGGIWLIYKGAITLAATPAADAITLEFRKQFRLHSQAPGLAFFIVGLMFVACALWFSRPPRPPLPIELEGELDGTNSDTKVFATSQQWMLTLSSTGEFKAKIVPDITYLVIDASSPGCDPIQTIVDTREQKDGKVHIDKLRFVKRIEGNPIPQNDVLPAPVALPPPDAAPSYGVAK